MKTKLRLIVCAILVVVSVNANATMAPVSRVKKTPNSNGDISLLISGPQGFTPVTITDYQFKLFGSSLELNIYLNTGMLPAKIHDLIVNTMDDLNPGQHSNTLETSFQIDPGSAALLILGLQNN